MPGFPRCAQFHGQRVDPVGKLFGQAPVDGALAGDAALALERGSDHADPEMGLAALAPAGVAVVLVALVDHLQHLRLEGICQLLVDSRLHVHGLSTRSFRSLPVVD